MNATNNTTTGDTEMSKYRNISERWGDNVPVTVHDYRVQSELFGMAFSDIEERVGDGIYIDGERVAEVEE